MVAIQKVDKDEPYPYVICSRRVDETGLPVTDCHTLWESASTERGALVYAKHRAKEGRWVEVYKNLYYYAPKLKNAI